MFSASLAEELCGESFAIKETLLSNISNADLLSALNYSNEKRISDFYCDLDFGVGKITTKLFFAMDFSPSVLKHSISQDRWPTFEILSNAVERLVGIDIFDPAFDEVKKRYTSEVDKWKSHRNQEIIRKISIAVTEIEDILAGFIEKIGQIVLDTLTEEIVLDKNKRSVPLKNTSNLTVPQAERLNKIRESNLSLSMEFETWRGFRSLTFNTYGKIQGTLLNCERHIQEIRSEISILKSTAKTRLTALLKDMATLNRLFKQLGETLEKRVSEPNYELSINGPKLATEIIKQRSWISEEINKLSNEEQSPSEIREFFLRCQDLFETLGGVFDEKHFSGALGATTEKKYRLPDPSQRISMPIKEVFRTGIHCAVYGDAGAGKSTTLHQYAAFASANDAENELTLFLPLTRILAELIQLDDQNNFSAIQKLEKGLVSFLQSGKCRGNSGIIDFIKSKRRITFVFDGVDEVIKNAPWIIEAIGEIENTYTNFQIILSSRSSGSYVDSIKYLGLTLLPFTDEQVSHFIDGWFVNNPETAEHVKTHLSSTPTLAEIVRSPLLTTILCVLAENRVPLPNGELSMYGERLKLLLGHYDIHKKTRRLSSHHTLLESTARKLAFYLHSRNIRSASPNYFEIAAINIFAKQLDSPDEQLIRRAVQELIDPCNILVPMTEDGEFGFGHLRYQEFLSASELRLNRGIDISPLLTSAWWRSVLVLFSRMTDDINYVITDVLEKQLNVTKCRESLLAMIATRGKIERRQLSSLIEEHVQLDSIDRELKDYHDFDSENWNDHSF